MVWLAARAPPGDAVAWSSAARAEAAPLATERDEEIAAAVVAMETQEAVREQAAREALIVESTENALASWSSPDQLRTIFPRATDDRVTAVRDAFNQYMENVEIIRCL